MKTLKINLKIYNLLLKKAKASRNPNNPHEIKVIHRTYNHHSKAFKSQFESNFHVAEPPEGAVEISQHHAQTLMRMQEQIPFRYGNK